MAIDAQKEQAELEKLRAEITQLRANAHHIVAQTDKLRRETAFYPFVVGSGVTLALVGVARLFLS